MDEPVTQNLRDAIDELRPRIADTRWQRIEVVEATGSTNADLMARAHEPEIVGTVRITTDQTAGRGRHTRVWEAPAGTQVAISAVLPAGDKPDRLGWLSLATGVAAASAIESVTSLRPVLKWPNDVLIDGNKVAGILAEVTSVGDLGIVVVGIGINTNMTAEQLPVPTATSLAIATGQPVDAAAVAVEYLRALSGQGWPEDIAAVTENYRGRCDTLGRRVQLALPGDETILGTAVDIDSDGRIVVEDADGRRTVAAAGDVTHLRSVD